MKILLVSNSPWTHSGYGTQMKSLMERLKRAGHNIVYFCNFGLQGGQIVSDGVTYLPGMQNGYQDPITVAHWRASNPDLVISLFDAWTWHNLEWPVPEMRWAAWAPVDTHPIAPAVIEGLQKVTYQIAYSEHGHREMKGAGFDKAEYIPHGVEKSYHFTTAGRKEMRRYLQVPMDAFLFGSVGLNMYFPGRKGFDRLIRAFSMQDENCYLYLHTTPNPSQGALDLERVAETYGVADRVLFPDPYNLAMGYSQNGMNAIYSAIDCYVQPTGGEGFGIPVLEAQACGAPVIATDCTSMPELLCPEASQLVPGFEYMTPDYAHRYMIDIEKLAESMREIMDIKQSDLTGYQAMRARCGLWANRWDWDDVWERGWKPWLEEVEKDVRLSNPTKRHRGGARIYEHEGRMRKQDSSTLAVKKELDLLLELSHPNIISVVGHGVEDGKTWFDMPKYRVLADIDPDSLTEEQKQRILTGISSALNYLHDRHYAHRDVEPTNVVLDDEHNPYLVDFEWAHPCEETPCVDFEPWLCRERAVNVVQLGMEERGYHTIVKYLKGIELDEAHATGLPGVPYQAIDGAGERDCALRWDIMQPDVKDKKVLDIGCNLGYFANRALEEGASFALGIDHDAPTIEAAKKLHPNVLFSVADLNNGGVPKERFDVAFLLSVLQHLKHPRKVLDAVLAISDTTYVEIPPRFIDDSLAEVLVNQPVIGESERGRPIYKVSHASR